MSLALDVAIPFTVGWPEPALLVYGRPAFGSNGVELIPENPTAKMLMWAHPLNTAVTVSEVTLDAPTLVHHSSISSLLP